MRKSYSLLFSFAALILLAAKQTETTSTTTIILNQGSPVLPDTPFDYTIYFPDFVTSTEQGATNDPTSINAEITDDGATLGRVLFYDKKLSANNELACSSCHKQEYSFADNTAQSTGINGTPTLRNSPNINALAWSGNFILGSDTTPLFWDARDTFLNTMVLKPIVHVGELGKDLEVLVGKLMDTEYYPALFEKAFGDSEITAERIGEALGQFVRSISSFNTKFDWVMTGESSFTPQEQEGFNLFKQNCDKACHSRPHFGVVIPMNTGLEAEYEDEGVGGWTGQPFRIGDFKSPSLRNVALTAPYMHDGRFETLEEVVDFYSDDVFTHPNHDFEWVVSDPATFTGFDFSASQKAAIVAFLHTLTDDNVTTAEKWSDPFPVASSTSFTLLQEKVEIFPNPVSSSATIKIDNSDGAQYDLRLTSLEGRVLRSFRTTASTVILEKEDLPAGIYLLEIMKEDQKKVERVLMQ